MPDAIESPASETPVGDFAKCHAGILAHLEEFSRLPGLLDPAAQARRIAESMLSFFKNAVFEHHREEEIELFPAVLASTSEGEEHVTVKDMVDRLVREHRQIEAAWTHLEPALRAVAKGRDAALDGSAVTALIDAYAAHARFEEERFLPLSQTILGRNANHMAALGLSLHIRRTMPEVGEKLAYHV